MENLKMDSRSPRQEILVLLQLLLTPISIYALFSIVIYLYGTDSISHISTIGIWLVGAMPGAVLVFKYYSNMATKVTFAIAYLLLMYPLLLLELLLAVGILGGDWL